MWFLVEALFEKIIPREKTSEESKKGKKLPDINIVDKEVAQTKILIESLSKELKEASTKTSELDKKIENIEKNPPLLESIPGGKYVVKRMKAFDTMLEEFNDKLDYVEDAKSQIFIQQSRIRDMHGDVEKKLVGLESLLDRLRSFDNVFKLANRLEDLEFEIKNTWIPLTTIEQMKSSIVEQNFFALLALLPLIKERESQASILGELKKLTEDMKRKNLWNSSKQVLMEEILRSQNVLESSY